MGNRMTEGTDDRSGTRKGTTETDPLRLISEALVNLRFGGIQLTVHEGKLVQMEVTEKRRFI
jgi:hypothetical protein